MSFIRSGFVPPRLRRILTLLCSVGLFGVLGVSLLATDVRAQDAAPKRSAADRIGLRGSAGISSHAYSTGLPTNRKAPFETRLFANASFGLLGMRSGIRLSYSTDDNQFRQSMNRISVRSSYDWKAFTVGDASPNLSRYSVRGTTVRGGMIAISPGLWNATVVAGRSRRAISPNAELVESRGGAFRRMLYAVKLGRGDERSSFASLTGLIATDVTSSLDAPGALRPAENMSLTPAAGARMFDGRLHLKAEITASAFNPDKTAAEISGKNIPSLFGSFVGNTAGSSVSYAGDVSMLADMDWARLNATYSRIEPQFESLGLERTRSDREIVNVQPQFRLLENKWIVTTQFMRNRDNLDNAKALTLKRYQTVVQSQAQLTPAFSLGTSYFRYWSDAAVASTTVTPAATPNPVSNTFTLAPTLTVSGEAVSHNLAATTSYQQFDTGTTGDGAVTDTWSSTANYSLAFASGRSYSAGINWLASSSAAAEVDVFNATVGAGRSLFDKSLTLSLVGGFAKTNTLSSAGDTSSELSNTQWNAGVTGRYRMPFGDFVQFSFRGLSNRASGDTPSYEEVQAVVRYEHRFR